MKCVIDASVVAKLFIPEELSEACEKAVRASGQLIAPDLLWIECASLLRKRSLRGDLDAADASATLLEMLGLPVETYSSWSLIQHALRISLETGRAVYDCMYLALAIQEDRLFLTADERLYNALAKHPLAAHLSLVGL